MRRAKVLTLSAIAALLAAALPLGAALYLSWQQALEGERAWLAQFAQRAAVRADMTITQVKTVLRALAPLEAAPCSEAHIARMLRDAFNAETIEQIGYYDERGVLRCSSWGRVAAVVREAQPNLVTPDGYEVAFNRKPLVSGGRSMMEVTLARHSALIDPKRFVDVIVDRPDMRIALFAPAGQVIGSLNNPDLALFGRMAQRTGDQFEEDGQFFAVVREKSGRRNGVRRPKLRREPRPAAE